MKYLTSLVLACAIAILGVAATTTDAEAQERYGKQKVVYHINYSGGEDDRAYRGALRNMQNHINAVGAENMDIKLVLHGDGLGVLAAAKTNQMLQGQVLELKGQNVAIHVCNNTLQGREISYENDLFDVFEEDIVPSGVAELSHLQMQGYTYIKP
ncbi:DsrE family protein [uncultured Marivita sp.]|uniref:DsrE family protein n=1 Tax=uncultured Marivita sp. TaxID=888080 RepID=UPI0026327A12|nr:DsrE family protein [uncultured Marivita sp.]